MQRKNSITIMITVFAAKIIAHHPSEDDQPVFIILWIS